MTTGDGSRHCIRHTATGQARLFGLHLTLGATPLTTASRQTPDRPVMMSPDLDPPGPDMARTPTEARLLLHRTATIASLAHPEVAEPTMPVSVRRGPAWPVASPVWPSPPQLAQEPSRGSSAPPHEAPRQRCRPTRDAPPPVRSARMDRPNERERGGPLPAPRGLCPAAATAEGS
jgi:hypothetical protein